MKIKYGSAVVLSFALLVFAPVSAAQESVPETGSASMRQQLLKKKEARQRHKTVRDIKETYRNINAAFKAGRKHYGREQVERMEELLQREDAPLSFRREMTAKLDGLKKRYGLVEKKIPVSHKEDQLSPEEIAQVEKLFALEYQMDGVNPGGAGRAAGTNDDRRARLQKEYRARLEALYSDAVLFYQHEFYALAGEVFREIERIEPGYKDTGKYLQSLDEDKELRDEKFSSSAARRQLIENLLYDEQTPEPSD